MNDITYEVDLNNDDLDLDKYNDFNQCLNNPVATIAINMQNVYGKNMTELFRAFDGANNFNDDYEGRGNIFYFDSGIILDIADVMKRPGQTSKLGTDAFRDEI